MGDYTLINMKMDRTSVSENRYNIIATYEVKETDGIHIRTVTVPVDTFYYPNFYINRSLSMLDPVSDEIDLGFGTIKAHHHIDIQDELVKPRIEKMTVAEIEKILGYKVEIVSEE